MEKEKSGFFAKLKNGLNKTRINLLDGLDSVFHGFSEIDEDFYEELEEVLVMADIGVATTGEIIDEIKTLVKVEHIKKPEDCRDYLINLLSDRLNIEGDQYPFEHENLSAEQRAEELIIMGLRLTQGINLQDFKQICGLDFHSFVNSRKLQDLKDMELLAQSDTHVYPTYQGMLVLNEIISELCA